MESDVVAVRFGEEDRKQIALYAKQKMETQSSVIRKATLQFIQREKESEEIKGIVARKFAERKISFDEMVRILGYEEAKKVAFFIEIMEKSFEEGA